MAYQGGAVAQKISAMGEAVAIQLALDELTALFGKDVRPHFLCGKLSNWSNDPWSLGAYSYSAVGMEDARAVLAAPLAGVLFFAGEATALNGHIATVHGAIETGRRAASEILGT
jgi:monoamine oxidase